MLYSSNIESVRNEWVEAVEAAIAVKGNQKGGMPALLENQMKKLTTIIAKMVTEMTAMSGVSRPAKRRSGWLAGRDLTT